MAKTSPKNAFFHFIKVAAFKLFPVIPPKTKLSFFFDDKLYNKVKLIHGQPKKAGSSSPPANIQAR